MDKKELEQTLVLIKPDALKNSLTGYVLSQLSEFHSGLRFAGVKVINVSRTLAEEHYAEHAGKPFYAPLLDYIMGLSHYPHDPSKQRVIAILYQGANAVKKIREISGPTNPHHAREQKPGCIRSLGTVVKIKNAEGKELGERMDNLIHASATTEEAKREIKLWFKPQDIPPLMRSFPVKLSENHYYYKDNKIFTEYKKGSICIISPSDTAWTSDLDALQLILKDEPALHSVQSIIAKYLINESISNQ